MRYKSFTTDPFRVERGRSSMNNLFFLKAAHVAIQGGVYVFT